MMQTILQGLAEIQFCKACKERMVFTFETCLKKKKSNSLWPMKIIYNSNFNVNK